MILGFTGTREGMTIAQRQTLAQLLGMFDEMRNGDCLGSDAQCFRLWKLGDFGRSVGHPCNLSSQRAYCNFDELLPEKPPLVRNHDIVDACGILIGCPEGEEILRSGTWATLRYAREIHKPHMIVWPSGSVSSGR